MFFGHTNNIDLNTINMLKNNNKNLIISQWNEDPIMPSLSDSKSNINKISFYSSIADHNFITTVWFTMYWAIDNILRRRIAEYRGS